MKRKNILLTAAVVLLAGGAALCFAQYPSTAAAPEAAPAIVQTAPSIRVVAAENRDLVERLSVNGTILPREEAVAGTDLNGLTVLQLNADQGDMVRKGDVLAVLDRSGLDTQLAQMEASRAQAEANIAQMQAQIGDAEVGVRQAQEALDRAAALKKKGVATEAQYDNAVNALDSANARLIASQRAVSASEAQLAVIDAQKQNVLLQLAKTEVKAPADGLVLARNATLGGVVSAAGGALFRIAINAEFELGATVAETVLSRIEPGMPAAISFAGAQEAVTGTVRRISPEVDQRSRLGSIRIALAEESHAKAGSFARGEVEIVHRVGLAVPASAIVFRGKDAFLQLVDAGRVKTVPVKLGARAGTDVEIIEGLAEGQEVVSRAGTFVADGDVVTPVRDTVVGAVAP